MNIFKLYKTIYNFDHIIKYSKIIKKDISLDMIKFINI